MASDVVIIFCQNQLEVEPKLFIKPLSNDPVRTTSENDQPCDRVNLRPPCPMKLRSLLEIAAHLLCSIFISVRRSDGVFINKYIEYRQEKISQILCQYQAPNLS